MNIHTSRLLFRVEESCYVEGHGVILAPGIPIHAYRGASRRAVLLRRPDGSTEHQDIDFFFSVLSPTPHAAHWLCRLVDMTTQVIPPGTEVWLLENSEH